MLAASGITAALLSLPLAFGFYYFERDLAQYEAGILCELKNRIAEGTGFLLSPWLGNGAPLLADPQAQILYPIRWLTLLVPAPLELSLGLIVHLSIGAAAMVWLGQSFRLRPLSAACLGLAFAFSGTVIDLAKHSCYVVAAAWVPLAWASVRMLLRRPSPWPAAALAVASAGVLLGGELQSYGVILGLVVLEACSHWFRRRGRARRALLLAVASAGAGTALGAVAWVGAYQEVALTARAGLLALRDALYWGFSHDAWIALIAPGALVERVSTGADAMLLLHPGMKTVPWNPTPYLGLLVVTAAVVGLGRRQVRTAALVATLGLVASLGAETPIFPWVLKYLSPLREFRFPAKYLTITTAAALVVAASLLQSCGRAKARHLRLAFLLAGGLAVALQTGAAFAARDRATSLAFLYGVSSSAVEHAGAMLPELSNQLFRQMMQAAAFLALALILIGIGRKARRYAGILVAADLIIAAPGAIEVGPNFFDISSPLREVPASGEGGPIFCMDESLWNVSLRQGSQSGTWEQIMVAKGLGIYTLNACDRIRSVFNYSALQTNLNLRLFDVLRVRHSLSAARALGCTHVVAPSGGLEQPATVLDLPGLHFLSDDNQAVQVFVVSEPLPIGFVSRRPALVSSEKELLRRLVGSQALVDTVALVDNPLHRPGGDSLPEGMNIGEVSVRWFGPDRASVDAKGTGGGVIGLRTSFQAGWTATQAGRSLPVVRVTGQHVAAVVEDVAAGPVDFAYLLPNAWAIPPLLALSALLAYSVWRVSRRPWGRSPSPVPKGLA